MNLFSQVVSEYKQVTWASLPEVVQVTIVVLLITIFISLMVLIFDVSFTTLMDRFSSFIKTVIRQG
ncbi:preprotein translocase subunit SecE [Pseudostreptobacillus hongkongensis]|nr:preprotein translocase subunit SecE [Pseudostreptobacillus hongkongensis]